MIKLAIDGYTAAPGAPKDYAPEPGSECTHLVVRARHVGKPSMFCESAWAPTPEELLMLQAGGQVILRVSGWQVPVKLYVEPRGQERKTVDA